MPITPFHFGPGFLVKSILPKKFSFRVFVLANIIIDIEPLYFMILNEWPLHRFLHTYVGATVVAVICVLIGKPVCYWVTEGWNRIFNVLRINNGPISLTALISASFIGSYSHVLLDSIMHRDIVPLNPFSNVNVLLNAFSYGQLHWGCILAGVLGIIIYFKRPQAHQSEHQPKLKKFVKILSVTLVLMALAYGVLMYCIFGGKGHGFLDDGPFTGTAYTAQVAGPFDSALRLNDTLMLEIYNRLDEAPVMVLRDHNDQIKWARSLIVSNVKNFNNAVVEKVELHKVVRALGGYNVQGTAYWTYGAEAANFYFDQKGNLKNFYLSW